MRSPWLTGSGGRLDLRRTGPIGAAPCSVAGRLAAHGAGRAPQHRNPSGLAVLHLELELKT